MVIFDHTKYIYFAYLYIYLKFKQKDYYFILFFIYFSFWPNPDSILTSWPSPLLRIRVVASLVIGSGGSPPVPFGQNFTRHCHLRFVSFNQLGSGLSTPLGQVDRKLVSSCPLEAKSSLAAPASLVAISSACGKILRMSSQSCRTEVLRQGRAGSHDPSWWQYGRVQSLVIFFFLHSFLLACADSVFCPIGDN